jgi:hypothetical protein
MKEVAGVDSMNSRQDPLLGKNDRFLLLLVLDGTIGSIEEHDDEIGSI